MIELSAAFIAVVSALWAAALTMAEESPAVTKALADEPSGPRAPVPLHRALQTGKLSLLLLGSAAAGTAVGWWYRPSWQGAGTFLVAGGLMLMIGEVLPRFVAQVLPESARSMTPLARKTLLPFSPLLGLVGALERVLLSLLPAPKIPPADLGSLEREMLLGVFSLPDTTVEEVMTPRIDIEGVDYDSNWKDAVEMLRRSDHSRLPVYRGSPDEIVGILYAKDLVPAIAGITPAPENWQEFVRPTDWVPESKTVEAQLLDFQRTRGNIAVVVDEFGGTAGLVTQEDVLEEIVGEIRDEYDEHEQPPIEKEGDNRLWVDGGVTLDEVAAETGLTFENDDVSTIGGLIYQMLGRVPNPGEELAVGDFRVVVEQIVRRRIKRVYMERRDQRAEQVAE